MLLFRHQEIGLRTLEAEDAHLLAKWLSDPAVLEYYEGRDRVHNLEMVLDSFFGEPDGETRCIIQYKQQDIGYLQFYPVEDEVLENYGYEQFEGKVYGMDQFIGETVYWNRGIGTNLLKETVNYLTATKGVDKIVMDPQAWNTRALKAYEKVGFVKKKLLAKHEWHEGAYRDCWLIEYERKET
ncbi:GNAT family N-acetyltransferase [Paenibacillus sp. GCM10027626]|uniref:GNAT family N-acetyltransferase n=1 Tax=Paenibacillus sp. GCM10027626 TaxID=3273411 RepID=UPI00363D9640